MPLTLRTVCSSMLRSNERCLDPTLLGQKQLKNVFNSKTFLNWRPLAGTHKSLYFTRGESQYEEGCSIKSCGVCFRQGLQFSLVYGVAIKLKVVQMLSPSVFATMANFFLSFWFKPQQTKNVSKRNEWMIKFWYTDNCIVSSWKYQLIYIRSRFE